MEKTIQNILYGQIFKYELLYILIEKKKLR